MFRRRFWWSLLLSLPVVATSHMVMDWFGYGLDFPGMGLVGPVLGTVIFAWAGWPFLAGGREELRARQPGMDRLGRPSSRAVACRWPWWATG